MKIHKIAKAGLKGRKKDSFLIILVITLAFIFIVSSTIFQSSIEKTKKEQAFDLYGEWQAAYLKADKEVLDRINKEQDINLIGKSMIIGKSEGLGLVGTFNQELLDIGRFSLYKGRFPTKEDEIVLELNQMSLMGLDLEVGQTISVEVTIPKYIDVEENFIKRSQEMINSTEKITNANYKETRDRLIDLVKELDDIIRLDVNERNYQDIYYNLFENYKRFKVIDHELLGDTRLIFQSILNSFGDLLDDRPKNLEDFLIIRKKLGNQLNRLESFVFYEFRPPINTYKYSEVPFEVVDDVTVVVKNSYIHYYNQGEKVNPEIIRDKGVLTEQSISLKKDFIITGILDTYSDKWDLGDYKAVNAFITEEAGKSFINALYKNTIEDFSNHKFEYNLFLTSTSLQEKLYEGLKDRYPNREEKSVVYYTTRDVDYNLSYLMGQDRATIEQELKKLKGQNNHRIQAHRLDRQGKDNSLEGIWNIGKEMEIDDSNFRKNTFSYSELEGTTESALSFVIIGVIFIATSLAIFQIFLTQIKRRSRKLVLLRAIGATKRQIIGIILYEGLYFLTRGLIIGVPIGFISVLSLLYGMNRIGGRDLKFYVDIRLLIPGLIAGILSLFLGMIIPMIYAVRIPLVGSMNRPSRSKSSYNKKRSTSYQSFNRINWEYIKANRGKTLLSFGISFVTITILLSSLFLCYYSFDNYKKLVLKPGRPDYALETYYGESYRKLLEQKKELLNIDGVENAYAYKVGRELHFWYEDINNNEMLKDFDKLLPADLRKVYFTKHNSNLKKMEVEPFISDAFLSKIYGIDPDSDLFKKYESFLTRGNIDREKFNAGEEVIILSPMYIKGEKNSIDNINLNKNTILDLTNEDNRMSWIFENTGSYKLSYDKQDSNHYIKQDFLKVGDRIQLSSSKEEVTAQSYESSFVTKQFKVAGIIDYFPQGSQWPFYHSKANYIVISSIRAMEDIYPFTVRGLGNFEPASMKAAVDTIYPNRYGRTLWYIDTDSKKQDVVLDSKLLAYAHNNNYTIYNYKESNAKLYQESFNNALIISLLGITASAIAFIILYNILESQMEQDRNRIGILQALGVTKKEFSTYYIKLGLINGILALGLINIILMTIMLISSNKNMHLLDRIKDALIYRLWLYPWLVHILLSVAFLSLTVLIYYLPARKVIENSPVENIRSLSR